MEMDLLKDEDPISDDEEFEKAIKDFDLKDILELMESLQTAMKKEQLHFEELSLQLQQHPDRHSHQHRKISAALCSSQRLLTNLCTKHIICSGQRSRQSSLCETTAENKLDSSTMSSSTIPNGNSTSGFKKSLRFFQSQVDKNSVFSSNDTNVHSFSCQTREQNNPWYQGKTNFKSPNFVPSVDNILSNVKTLCATRNGKHSSVQPIHKKDGDKEIEHPITSGAFKTSVPDVKHSEQNSVNKNTVVPDHSQRISLSSSFNPTFEPDECTSKSKTVNVLKTDIQFLNSSCQSYPTNDSKKPIPKVDSLSSNFEKNVAVENLNFTSNVKEFTNRNNEQNFILNDLSDTFSRVMQTNDNDCSTLSTNRTFGDCKSQMENNKASSKCSKFQSEQKDKIKAFDSRSHKTKDDADSVLEKQTDSFECDYNSQDFIVHKATFPEDYLETMSEDNYSSMNEDNEMDPDIPSPDYASEEEEHLEQHEEIQFVDNSLQYINDPRRYMYYDDKELEVIPEEDEDDIQEYEEMHSHQGIYKPGVFLPLNLSSDDSRYHIGECDSGLTDDQRSSSSTAEECELLEDDTDSAQGSLPRQDSSGESPTHIMFPNTEYQRSTQKKRSTPCQRIMEDYEKPKVNGKNVEIVDQNGEDEQMRQARSTTSSWDPNELLKVLYRLDVPTESLKKQTRYINKEGYLEKLPSGRRKATYWNPWKTKYIKLKDGFLYCYDNINSEKASLTLQLMGGHIDSLESKMIGVDDQKGHYIVLRCSDENETESWENALNSHCAEDFVNTYTNPCLYPMKISKDIIIIDLGSCSIRAGILMSSPSLPQLFFPSVCAINKVSHKKIYGMEALKPCIRKSCLLEFPLHPSAKVTKYSIDVSSLPDLMKHIFCELNVQPEHFKIQLSMPRNLTLQTKLKIANMLLNDFKVKGINLSHQAILSLHAYNSKSGIIVDIGDRLDVIPIIEGYIVESGVTRLPYGGQRMIHHLKHALAEKNISVVSDVETYLARYILEQLCYVAHDYNEELQRYHTSPEDFEMSISTSHFFKEDSNWDEILLDLGRFHVPEGLFTPEKWGIDNPGLHKLVHHAIQECGVDLRREMSRSIYVSGGLTLLPGFAERLENEVNKLTPNTISPKVHASPYRYHMSYIGACQIALGDKFDDICITKQIWKKEGNTCVKKWHI